MAFSETYDAATPQGDDSPTEADDRMVEIKAGVQERENVDHYWPLTGTEVSDDDTGEHRKLTIRTLTPAEVAALTATKAYLYRLSTDGELYFKDDDDNTIQLTSGGYIEGTSLKADSVGAAPIQIENDTYLKAANEADDDEVDLIKAGRNEADDADVAQIPDSARLATNAAPTEDTQIPNKKYIDDQITEGDWRVKAWANFSVGAAPTYTITVNDNYNVSGVTRQGSGHYRITWDTAFANTNYCVVATVDTAVGTLVACIFAQATTYVDIKIWNILSAVYDGAISLHVMAIGDQ